MANEPAGDPLWYKDAVIYQVHVKAFRDSSGDGVGDFPGLTSKLDYLQSLGVTAIWLMPFYPSPLRDDGYDIADYTDIHPAYGTLRDFKTFLREAHRRGLRVITELVMNHTSDQHPWFQRARRAAPGSVHRDFYVWSDTPDRYPEARIIFKDFEHSNWAWDPVAGAYYWHRFYSHQPDLNYDNPAVFKAVTRALDFWLEMGVDGLRLDAVPYLFEREGTNCENLPETHDALRRLRRHIDARYPGRMLLAEANQWPEDAVAYFGDGDECQMAFHFPVMPRLFMAVRMEDRFPIIDILAQTPPIPPTAQWGLFLRNHDELTLEMVTDEERDYMYRVYAADPEARINLGIRRRLAPLLGNHRRRIELMTGLLLSLPGTPFIYYGDEIGMGDNIYLGDRNGVRTPMQWSADRNAGFSSASPQRLYLPIMMDPEYHYEAVNVEAQQRNQLSLLWWMRRTIALRRRHPAFGRGALEFLSPRNRAVLALIRRHEDETLLVVVNLSRYVQYVELELGEFRDQTPVELFGQTSFPPIGDRPYLLTLAPHTFLWFALEPRPVAASGQRAPAEPADAAAGIEAIPTLTVSGGWEGALRGAARPALEAALPAYLRARRWFRGKARPLKQARIVDTAPVPFDGATAYLTLVAAEYTDGDGETYLLPLAFADGERAARLRVERSPAIVAELRPRGRDGGAGVLYDALWEPAFARALLDAVARRRTFQCTAGAVAATQTAAFRAVRGLAEAPPPAIMPEVEQSNTSIFFGDGLTLKVFRRVEEGVNPELELGRFLTERTTFTHIAPVVGALEHRRERGAVGTLAILQLFVPNEGDAWSYTLAELRRYFETVAALPPTETPPRAGEAGPLDLAERPLPAAADGIGAYLEAARLLGQRTAELHAALASDPRDPALAPEPFTTLYQRALYQSQRTQIVRTLDLLRQAAPGLPDEVAAEARRLLDQEAALQRRARAVVEHKLGGARSRGHGDYHLGQILTTGNDFVILDFEGEPARPLSERRLKRSPLRDVAGMIRSFHYAVAVALREFPDGGPNGAGAPPALAAWARFWRETVVSAFLGGYLAVEAVTPLLPATRAERALLLDFLLLEKAVYELGYELNNRPAWALIPIQGILEALDVSPAPVGALGE